MENNKSVKIIIPVYKNTLDATEYQSLNQCCSVLANYPKAIVKPESLDISPITSQFSQLGVENFDDSFFTSIETYNSLMLSAEFYSRFLEYDYILIYQLDAYIFRDELTEWCAKAYDYIGAPWIPRGKFWKKTGRGIRKLFGLPVKKRFYDCYYQVGNGGFSLRRTKTFHRLVPQAKPEDIPEDIVWSRILRKEKCNLPDYREALLFAFDKYPENCFRITGKIPFGCHAWNRKKMFGFWEKYMS
jgi:hypothetical protein